MPIKSVHLERIGCYSSFDIDLSVVNILVGPGGVGKTTAIRGLQWLFTGRVEGYTNKAGTFTEAFGYNGTFDFLARSPLTGKKGEAIEFARIQEGPSLENQRVELSVNGVKHEGKREQLQQEFYSLTCGPASWFLMLNSERFGSMTSVDQSKTLAIVMGGQLTTEELREKVAMALGAVKPSLTAGEMAEALRFWGLEAKPTDWDLTKKHFEDRRRDVRKLIAAIEERMKMAGPEPDAKRLAELRTRRIAVEGEKNAIIREPAPTEDEIVAAETRLQAMPNPSAKDIGQLEAAKTAALAAEQKLDQNPVSDPTDIIADLEARIKQAEKAIVDGEAALSLVEHVDATELSALERKVAEAEAASEKLQSKRIADPTSEIVRLNADIAAAGKADGKPCPYCGHALSSESVAALQTTLAEKEKQATQYKKWLKDSTAADEAFEKARAIYESGRTQAEVYQTKAAKMLEAKATITTLKANLAERQEQAKAWDKWNAKLVAAGEATDNATQTLDEALANAKAYKSAAEALTAMKNKAEACKLRRPLAEVSQQLDEIVAETAKLEEAEQKSDEKAKDRQQIDSQKSQERSLEALITVYAPDGVRQSVATKRDEFVDAVHQGLRQFFPNNADVKVWLDTGKMSLTGEDADARAICTFSESERARLGLSIQCAVGIVDGIWLAVSDHFAEVYPDDQNNIIESLSGLFKEEGGNSVLAIQVPRPQSPTEWAKSATERARKLADDFDKSNVQVIVIDEQHSATAVE